MHQKTFPAATQDKNATASKEGSVWGLDSLYLTFKTTYQDLHEMGIITTATQKSLQRTQNGWRPAPQKATRTPGYLQVGSRECSHVERDRTDAGAHCRLGLVFIFGLGGCFIGWETGSCYFVLLVVWKNEMGCY